MPHTTTNWSSCVVDLLRTAWRDKATNFHIVFALYSVQKKNIVSVGIFCLYFLNKRILITGDKRQILNEEVFRFIHQGWSNWSTKFVLDWLTFEEDCAIRNKANSEIWLKLLHTWCSKYNLCFSICWRNAMHCEFSSALYFYCFPRLSFFFLLRCTSTARVMTLWYQKNIHYNVNIFSTVRR